MVAICAPAILVQILGVWWCTRGYQPEIDLLVGFLLYALGTIGGIYGIERYVESIGRPGRWALTALLGPVGPLVAIRLKRGAHALSAASPGRRTLADRIVGILLTLAAGAALGWAALEWSAGSEWPRPTGPPSLQHHEQLAYRRLQAIAVAQRRYAEKDWDGDGQKTHASFYTHLWQSVDGAGKPVPVGLIDRDLAFAMVEKYALDGYVFRSLHHHDPDHPAGPSTETFPSFQVLDPKLAWAVVATPVTERKTGLLGFIADSSGTIWTYQRIGTLPPVTDPSDPTQHGWIKIRTAAHLAEIQQLIEYPKAVSSAGP